MFKILAIPVFFLFHPVHVTLTSIDQEAGNDSLKVFVRIYFDDFLRDYLLYDVTAGPMDKYLKDGQFSGQLMNNYLNDKVIISVNNKVLKGKLLNLAIKDNEISANLVYRSTKKPRIIMVTNSILTGLYTDQSNMTMIKIGDFEEGVKLTPENKTESFKIK
jgi:hypothetical protein